MKEWMELVDYKITEGSSYGWHCFGYNAYSLDSWNGDHNGHSFTITFDTETQTAYMVEAHDFKNNRAYRMIDPAFKTAYDSEVKTRGVDDQAWEDDQGNPIKYIDLEVDDDFFQKSLAIKAGESYDTRVQIEVNFTEEEMFQYMKFAHEQDITFNQLVERAVRAAIEQHETFKEWV
jgi:hypothetical protein